MPIIKAQTILPIQDGKLHLKDEAPSRIGGRFRGREAGNLHQCISSRERDLERLLKLFGCQIYDKCNNPSVSSADFVARELTLPTLAELVELATSCSRWLAGLENPDIGRREEQDVEAGLFP